MSDTVRRGGRRRLRAGLVRGGPAMLALALTLAGPARGAELAQAQGDAAAAGLRAWLADLLGPGVPIDASLLRLKAAGDHFDVTVPLPFEAKGEPPRLTGQARPLENGKWAFTGLRLVTPVRVTSAVPISPKPGAPPALQPVTIEIRIDSQDISGVIDPAFASPTSWTGTLRGLSARGDNPLLKDDIALAAQDTTVSIRPAGEGRLDISGDSTMRGYRVVATSDNTGVVTMGIDVMRINAALNGLSRERGARLVRFIAGLPAFYATKPGPAPGAAPRLAPEMVKAALEAIEDLASVATLDETIEGISVKANGIEGRLARARIGVDAHAQDGLLRAAMDIGAEDLSVPGLPLGPFEQLLPRRIALRPFLANVAVKDLMAVLRGMADGGQPDPVAVKALYGHGGIATGIENLQLDLGGASFTGGLKLTMSAPEQATGTGQLVAQGFDTLLATLQALPQAQQILPMLLFAKGIGHQTADKLVWDLAYDGKRMLVNGVDLTAMAPPGKGQRRKP